MPTRLYFDLNDAPSVSPAFGGWNTTSGAVRRRLLDAKSSGESLSSILGDISGNTLLVQYVSEPLTAQTIDGTIKAYLRGEDPFAYGDYQARLLIRVFSNDGSSVRGTLATLGHYGPGTFFADTATNRAWADGDSLSAVAAQDGDRLVVEIGINSTSGDIGLIYVGAPSGTSDLPENETETGALVPWIELSADLTFQTEGDGASTLALLGVG